MLILFQKCLKTVLFSSKYLSAGNLEKSQCDSHIFVNFDWSLNLALQDMQINF